MSGQAAAITPSVSRAATLAKEVLEYLPPCRGYVGLDLVLGDDPAEDCLIEINPRLTMSYPVLGPLTGQNLASLMLHAIEITP